MNFIKLNSDLESTNKPAFTTATTRENIASGESLSTILGKIAKWFTDLKTGAFNTVANNLTTTASGYVLDARQGKTLLSKITSGLTRLSSSTGIGKMVLPNGAIVVYGAILSSSMSSDNDTGGYSATVNLSSYGLTAPLFAMVTARYPNGHPFATIHSIDDTNKKIKLGCNVSNTTCYIEWLVIG